VAASTHPPVADRRRERGFTLTELLVATLLSLVVMGAVASLFGLFGRTVRLSQATVDMSALMRTAAWQLRQDLTGVTCEVVPRLQPETNSGYFELLEGPAHDASYALDGQSQPTGNLEGDTDDILLFTTQSLGGPFVGRYGTTTMESPYAEVAWFCRPAAEQPIAGTTLYSLYRRQLLVTSYLGRTDLTDNSLPLTIDRGTYDFSVRTAVIEGQGTVLLPNSLGDLTKRENRFLRSGYSYRTEDGVTRAVPLQPFPFAFPLEPTTGHAIADAALEESARGWEHIILPNVLAFDVRVYDPQVMPLETSDQWLLPGDPGYTAPADADGPTGAYVDLGRSGAAATAPTAPFPPTGQSAFQSGGVQVTDGPRSLSLPVATYDTWSDHYEFNGVDDDGDGVIDEGSNGFDADGDGWPEYSGDVETSSPYPVVLRGIEVRIRCYEPTSKQIRQITIRHSFVK
jgi:prepilin-type N-terminal cleavage/methylation domain-containing protein